MRIKKGQKTPASLFHSSSPSDSLHAPSVNTPATFHPLKHSIDQLSEPGNARMAKSNSVVHDAVSSPSSTNYAIFIFTLSYSPYLP
jgi:hypothetical protein